MAAQENQPVTLTLVTRGHAYAVSYQVGDESAAIEHLATMAKDPSIPFDWFDAAVLSHQIGQRLARELKAYIVK